MLEKIQNGGSAKIQNTRKLSLNIARVSAVFAKIQNGAFVTII
jgi:hypothetical protein